MFGFSVSKDRPGRAWEVVRYAHPSVMINVVQGLACLLFSAVITAAPVDFERQSIRIAMTQEPPSLNSTQTTDLVSYFLLGHVTEGLLRYDRRGRLVAGVAESWEVEATKLVFNLRQDAKWHDGRVVTANDFVYAWRLVNDPEEAAPFAAIMYPIRNAEAVQRGELPVEMLGVRAVGDHKLVVDLERPCGFCLNLMPHATFFPINQAFHQQKGSRYGAEAEHLLSNGPFMLTEWVHEARLMLRKNPNYWNRAEITLNEIEVGYITSDNRTRLNLFRDEQIAFARLGGETVKDAVDQGMRLRTFLSGGVAYLTFNVREGRPTANKSLRRAVQLSFDADEYVNQVIGIPGYRPTNTLFPGWLKGEKGAFNEEYPAKLVKRDLNLAREFMKEASKELGDIGSLTLLTVSSPTGAKVAEYFQGELQQNLGLDVLVDQQSFKQYLNKSRGGQFDLVLQSWYPDFDDLVTYADLMGSYNANNRGGFENKEYDHWLTVLRASVEPVSRFEAAAKLQDIITEEVPILPTAETGSAYLLHPRLKGVVRRVIGQDPDFTHARVLPDR